MAGDEVAIKLDGQIVLVVGDIDAAEAVQALPHRFFAFHLGEVLFRFRPAALELGVGGHQVFQGLLLERDRLAARFGDFPDDSLEGLDRAAEFAQVEVDPAQLVQGVVEGRVALVVLNDLLVVHLGQGQVVGLEEVLCQGQVGPGDVFGILVFLHQLIEVLHAFVAEHAIAQGLALRQGRLAQSVQDLVDTFVVGELAQHPLVVLDGALVVLHRLHGLRRSPLLADFEPLLELLVVGGPLEQVAVVGLVPVGLSEAEEDRRLVVVARVAGDQALHVANELAPVARLLSLEPARPIVDRQLFKLLVVELALLHRVRILLHRRLLGRLLDRRLIEEGHLAGRLLGLGADADVHGRLGAHHSGRSERHRQHSTRQCGGNASDFRAGPHPTYLSATGRPWSSHPGRGRIGRPRTAIASLIEPADAPRLATPHYSALHFDRTNER